MAYEEPEILIRLNRTYKDKAEALQLERGSFQGRSTFTLRQVWQPPGDDGWRWSRAREDSKGRCWASMSVKARELRELGEALIAAAEAEGGPSAAALQPPMPSGVARRPPTPREQRELDRFDARHKGDIPF